MKKVKLLLVVVLMVFCGKAKSQDTIKVMYYNLMNFPAVSQTRADTLKKIVQYVLPDAFVVNELTSQFGAILILNNALNQNGINYYQQAAFMDGPDTDNLLFYNSNKLGLVSQRAIGTNLRDINEYIMYYKDPNLAVTLDTAYFYFYSCHLKAGSSAPNPTYRLNDAQIFKNYLSGLTNPQNIILGGDFNFYSSSSTTEPAFDEIINGGTVLLNDPINMPGAWNNNSLFASIHTQSTRTTSFDGGATGGLDDRFDIVFTSTDLINGTNKAKYITNSYKAFGQDGLHFNSSIVSPLANSTVPSNIANALHQMSDHLPVYMEVEVGGPLSIAETEFISNYRFNSVTRELEVLFDSNKENVLFTVYDLTGKLIRSNQLNNTNRIQTTLTELNAGIYIVNLEVEGKRKSLKIVVL